MSAPSMFDPLAFRRGPPLKNRFMLAPMTNLQSGADGVLSDEEFHWLTRRAEGGFGMTMTCASHVDVLGQGFEGQLGCFDDLHLEGLTRLAGAIRERGSRSCVQLHHAGMRSPAQIIRVRPVCPSENIKTGARGLTLDEVRMLVESFVQAAERADKAGFDGVEVHGAHGYLISQFLGTVTNTREDEWGGSLERRARFVREVLSAVKDAVPESFLVGVRLSPEIPEQGIVLDEALQVARWLVEDGVDFMHVSNWDSFKATVAHPDSKKPLTTWFREAVGPEVPVIATGGVWTPAEADTLLEHGADLVGLARAAIGNARWPEHAATPGWDPVRPPYPAEHLRENALGEAFVDYMRRWPGFVAE